MNPVTTECCHVVNTKRWLSPAAHLSACDRGQGLQNKPEIKAEKRRSVTKKLQKMPNDWINYSQIHSDISDYAQLDLFPAQTDDVSRHFPSPGSTNDTSAVLINLYNRQNYDFTWSRMITVAPRLECVGYSLLSKHAEFQDPWDWKLSYWRSITVILCAHSQCWLHTIVSLKCAASSETPLTPATDSLPSFPLGGATGLSDSSFVK